MCYKYQLKKKGKHGPYKAAYFFFTTLLPVFHGICPWTKQNGLENQLTLIILFYPWLNFVMKFILLQAGRSELSKKVQQLLFQKFLKVSHLRLLNRYVTSP